MVLTTVVLAQVIAYKCCVISLSELQLVGVNGHVHSHVSEDIKEELNAAANETKKVHVSYRILYTITDTILYTLTHIILYTLTHIIYK